MADLIALVVALLVTGIVLVRKTSSGMAILAVFAGVTLEQLLSKWIIGYIPNTVFDASPYVLVALKLILTFTPVVVVLFTAKTARRSSVLSLLAGLVLGVLLFSFGLKIVDLVPDLNVHTKNSGLLHFIDPYMNLIISFGVVLAIFEMIFANRVQKLEKSSKSKGKKGKH